MIQETSQLGLSAAKISNGLQLAFAEAYVNGMEVPDGLLKTIFLATAKLSYNYMPFLLVPYDWLQRESVGVAEDSDQLMQRQYDLPEQMFVQMLEESPTIYPKYTMALWENGATTLQEAQKAMLDDVIAKAEIQDGDKILDLGCGWGSAANYILGKFPNASVSSLNLSHGQCEYIRRKMNDPDSHLNTTNFRLYEQDLNDMRIEQKFDKIIAIGLLEHVGNLTDCFRKLSPLLQDNGRVFVHIISTSLPFSIMHPFIGRNVFPGARIWSKDMIPALDMDLRLIKSWYINGKNYSRTLNAWLRNFDASQDQIAQLDFGIEFSKFRRMWRYYLLLCIALFEASGGETLGNAQFLMEKK